MEIIFNQKDLKDVSEEKRVRFSVKRKAKRNYINGILVSDTKLGHRFNMLFWRLKYWWYFTRHEKTAVG